MTETVPDKPKPKRRWSQFRLKTIFILVAVCAVPLAWLAWKIDQKRHERAVIAELEGLGGIVEYDWQGSLAGPGFWSPTWDTDVEPNGPPWLRQILGDSFFSQVKYVFLPTKRDIFEAKHWRGPTAGVARLLMAKEKAHP